MDRHPGIRIDSIRVEGAGGLIFAIGTVLVVLIAVPALRPLAAASLLGGLLFAPIFHLGRR